LCSAVELQNRDQLGHPSGNDDWAGRVLRPGSVRRRRRREVAREDSPRRRAMAAGGRRHGGRNAAQRPADHGAGGAARRRSDPGGRQRAVLRGAGQPAGRASRRAGDRLRGVFSSIEPGASEAFGFGRCPALVAGCLTLFSTTGGGASHWMSCPCGREVSHLDSTRVEASVMIPGTRPGHSSEPLPPWVERSVRNPGTRPGHSAGSTYPSAAGSANRARSLSSVKSSDSELTQ
jgi:hypothetical protein